MIKRAIIAVAALCMVYGSTMIPQAGTPGKVVKDDRKTSIDRKTDTDGSGVEADKGGAREDMRADRFPRIRPVEVSGSIKGVEVNDLSGDSEPISEGKDFGGTLTNEGPIYGETETADTEPVDEYEPEPSADDDVAEPAEEPEREPEQEPVEGSPAEPSMEYLGDWTISFYCPCYECCREWSGGPTASGAMPQAWYTCATDGLDFGTILYVDGIGYLEVQDRGTDYGWLDIYVNSHDEALANGLQTRSVYIVH